MTLFARAATQVLFSRGGSVSSYTKLAALAPSEDVNCPSCGMQRVTERLSNANLDNLSYGHLGIHFAATVPSLVSASVGATTSYFGSVFVKVSTAKTAG